MDQVLPVPILGVDALEVYLRDERPAYEHRPWVVVNMISSIDGASAFEESSRGLASKGDRAVLRALRACCDWIVVGSRTANLERYRLPSPNKAALDFRLARGQTPAPQLAIVTASGNIDPTLPALLPEGNERRETSQAVVFCGTEALAEHLAELNAEIVRLNVPVPTPDAVIGELHKRGAKIVLCEGGPNWNAQLAKADLIDEFCLTISPTIAMGNTSRIVAETSNEALSKMHLHRLLTEDNYLFARYTRTP